MRIIKYTLFTLYPFTALAILYAHDIAHISIQERVVFLVVANYLFVLIHSMFELAAKKSLSS